MIFPPKYHGIENQNLSVLNKKSRLNSRNFVFYIMKWSGWPLTVIIIAISLGISFILYQFGIHFFFLPIIFIPFLRFVKTKKKIQTCPVCGLESSGNYCSRCGTRLN